MTVAVSEFTMVVTKSPVVQFFLERLSGKKLCLLLKLMMQGDGKATIGYGAVVFMQPAYGDAKAFKRRSQTTSFNNPAGSHCQVNDVRPFSR